MTTWWAKARFTHRSLATTMWLWVVRVLPHVFLRDEYVWRVRSPTMIKNIATCSIYGSTDMQGCLAWGWRGTMQRNQKFFCKTPPVVRISRKISSSLPSWPWSGLRFFEIYPLTSRSYLMLIQGIYYILCKLYLRYNRPDESSKSTLSYALSRLVVNYFQMAFQGSIGLGRISPCRSFPVSRRAGDDRRIGHISIN